MFKVLFPDTKIADLNRFREKSRVKCIQQTMSITHGHIQGGNS